MPCSLRCTTRHSHTQVHAGMVAGLTKHMMRKVLNTTTQAPAMGQLAVTGRSNSAGSLGEQQNSLAPLNGWADAPASSLPASPKKSGFYWPPAAPAVSNSNPDETQAAECLPTSTPAVSGAQLSGSMNDETKLGAWLDATTQRNTRSGCCDEAAGIESLPELRVSTQRKKSVAATFETLQTRLASMRRAKHDFIACTQAQDCSVTTGGCRTACPSRPSSNESQRSCDTFTAQFHNQQHMRCPYGDNMLAASKRSTPSAHASRCPVPRSAKKSPRLHRNRCADGQRSVSPRHQFRRSQLTPSTSSPDALATSISMKKRSSPDAEEHSEGPRATPRKRIALKPQRASSSSDLRSAGHAHFQRMHDSHASARQCHSWDGQKLTLPHIPSLSSESEETSAPRRCHSVLSLLCAQRSPASAALHSTEIDSSDSEDDPDKASQDAIRNISFLNLDYSRSRNPIFMNSRDWSTRDSSVAAQWSEFKNNQRVTPCVGAQLTSSCNGYESDEDLQAMPLLPAEPPVTPSNQNRHLEASGSFNKARAGSEAPMTADGAADAALRRLEACGSFNKSSAGADTVASGAADEESRAPSRVSLQLKVVGSSGDCMHAMHLPKSPTAAPVVASIGLRFQDLYLEV